MYDDRGYEGSNCSIFKEFFSKNKKVSWITFGWDGGETTIPISLASGDGENFEVTYVMDWSIAIAPSAGGSMNFDMIYATSVTVEDGEPFGPELTIKYPSGFVIFSTN